MRAPILPTPIGARWTFQCAWTIDIQELDGFIVRPEHQATVTGEVRCEALGGRMPVEWGTFNLFVEEPDPEHR